MKNIFYFFSMLIFISLSSCKKLLDTKPTDFLSPVTYYESEVQLNFALAGVYDILGSGPIYGTHYISRFGMEADEGCFSPSTVITGPQVYNYTASDPNIENFWKNLYVGINRANVLIANVDKNVEINENVRNQIRGEALFLRAYYYFLLVQNFGGVPLMLQPTKSAFGNEIPKSTIKEVYEVILSDMETAESLVPSISTLGFGGRVSKSAVRGILARVCLYMAGYPLLDKSKYEAARMWAKKVIDDTEALHVLNLDYKQVFINYAQDKYDIKESIWEVEFWGSSGVYRETGQVGAWIGITSTNADIGVASGFVNTTAKLYNAYESTDVRRDWSISNFTYTAAGVKTYLADPPLVASLYTRKVGKYRREYELVTPKSNNATPINWPILRFSDVLLMYAEADFELNGPPAVDSESLNYINLVRARANATTFNASNHITDPNEFKEFIIEERSRELCFEALRKPDLIRWGIIDFIMTDMKNRMAQDIPNQHYSLAFRNYIPKYKILPIPTQEVILNKSLVQNQGW